MEPAPPTPLGGYARTDADNHEVDEVDEDRAETDEGHTECQSSWTHQVSTVKTVFFDLLLRAFKREI